MKTWERKDGSWRLYVGGRQASIKPIVVIQDKLTGRGKQFFHLRVTSGNGEWSRVRRSRKDFVDLEKAKSRGYLELSRLVQYQFVSTLMKDG